MPIKITMTSEGDYFFIEINDFTYCTKGIKAAFALLEAMGGVIK